MDHKYVIGEYVVLTNPRDEQDARWNWRIQSWTEEGGVTRYVVSTETNAQFEKTLSVTGEDLRPLHNEHAHIEKESRDCDGRYTRSRVEMLTAFERRYLFGDALLKERVLINVVTLHGEGTLKVRPTGLDWYENTDEGYRSAEVRWCTDDTCSDTRSSYRDHTAEAAGY